MGGYVKSITPTRQRKALEDLHHIIDLTVGNPCSICIHQADHKPERGTLSQLNPRISKIGSSDIAIMDI